MSDTSQAAAAAVPPANPLWGGRFKQGGATLLEEINASIHFDKRLARQDIAGSLAHAAMLVRQGILDEHDGEQIRQGLRLIEQELEQGIFPFDAALEDIHMNVEHRLHVLIGDAAGRLHTARSRNDQVALDMKLWVRGQIDALDAELAGLVRALAELGERHAASPMPGFTHMQCAQPVSLGHHLLAYGEMFLRDRSRLADARARLNESPLGAAALAGTRHPIDRKDTARALGFKRISRNSIDAVSDRDYVLEFLAVAAILATHMSRLGEEVVVWCTSQFGYAVLSEELSAGSSIMPQKRNPDAAELIRAKSGRVIGSLVSLLVVMKGLPLAYSRDLQEDKEGTFDAAATVHLCVRTTTAVVRGLSFDVERMRGDAASGNALATDLADWLVQNRAMPFRQAHGVVGRIVKQLEQEGVALEAASAERIRTLEPDFAEMPATLLSVEGSLASRDSFGGTNPTRVLEAARQLGARNEIGFQTA